MSRGAKQITKRRKRPKLDADFCRHLLITVGKNDAPSAGTLGAVMYKLKIFDAKTAQKQNSSRTLVEYLAQPEYRHHLSPAIMLSLARIESGAVRGYLKAAQISPKIYKQLQLLLDLGLTTCTNLAVGARGQYLTPLGIELFKNWPSLRAPVSRHVERALVRAHAAEHKLAAVTEYAKKLQDSLETKQRQLYVKEQELLKLRQHT